MRRVAVGSRQDLFLLTVHEVIFTVSLKRHTPLMLTAFISGSRDVTGLDGICYPSSWFHGPVSFGSATKMSRSHPNHICHYTVIRPVIPELMTMSWPLVWPVAVWDSSCGSTNPITLHFLINIQHNGVLQQHMEKWYVCNDSFQCDPVSFPVTHWEHALNL